MERRKCVIIGSGPAGYTAAIYTGRALLEPVLYEGMLAGGQLTTTTDVENFPGYPEGVTGMQMMEDMRRQAERFGAELRRGIVTAVDLGEYPFVLTIDDGKQVTADTVIIATGANARYLGIPNENKYKGMGVSACATCDGFFCRNQDVAVIGGGDTACEDAIYLSNLARKVYMIVRKPHLRASHIMQKRVRENPKIELLLEHTPKEVLGDDSGMTGLMVVKSDGTERKLDVTSMFVAIGRTPNTKIFEGQLEMDGDGYIKRHGHTSQTSVKGVFVAGDVCDPHYRQAVIAAGSGCVAALDAERFLLMEGEVSPLAPPPNFAEVAPNFGSKRG